MLDEADRAEPQESAFLRAVHAGCVVCDIPPVALRLAQNAGIPGIAVTNFSWDWIYDGWTAEYPEAGPLAERMRRDYACGDLLLRLPFSGDLPAFRMVEDVPMLGRKSRLPSDTVRERLGLAQESRPVVLLSFGGMGLNGGDFPGFSGLNGFRFVSTFRVNSPVVTLLPDFSAVDVRYPDLVGAVDVVITKPGYGIVSECAVNHTRMLYTERGAFREYDAILKELSHWNCSRYVARDRLLQGCCKEDLEELMEQDPTKVPGAREAGEARGAACIAATILDRYESGRVAR